MTMRDAPPPVVASSEVMLLTRWGAHRAVGFRLANGDEHVALVVGEPSLASVPLVRIQSSCVTSTALGAIACDCAAQVELSALRLVDEGAGILLYLSQEGAGHGLTGKLWQMGRAAAGEDVVAMLEASGAPVDPRTYDAAAAIVRTLLGRPGPIRLLTNNPRKLAGVRLAGLDVTERLALEVEPTEYQRDYLAFKKSRLGHLLTKV